MKIIQRLRNWLFGKHIKICSRDTEVKITFTIAPNKCLEVKNNDAILGYSFETKGGGGGGGGGKGCPGDITISPGNLTVHESFGDVHLGDNIHGVCGAGYSGDFPPRKGGGDSSGSFDLKVVPDTFAATGKYTKPSEKKQGFEAVDSKGNRSGFIEGKVIITKTSIPGSGSGFASVTQYEGTMGGAGGGAGTYYETQNAMNMHTLNNGETIIYPIKK
jgi:hypothetical protein